MPDCSVTRKSWGQLTTDDLYSFLKLRTDVFFVEQKVDEEELDNRDREDATEHYWMTDDSGTAAYLRVLHDPVPEHLDAHRIIGRVVVRADRRGEGLAQQLIAAAIADFGDDAMMLHAQSYAASLYAKAGFVPFGDEFVEAGIIHTGMYRAAPAV